MDDNVNGKVSQDRDAWMGMEKTLFEELLKDTKNKEKYELLRKVSSHELHSKAMKLIEEIESGKLLDWEIYLKVEEITLLLAAIEDAQRENEKERIWDGDEEKIRAKVQKVIEQIIQKNERLPKDKLDKLGEIIKKYGIKNVASFLAVSALGKPGFRNNLIIKGNGPNEQEAEEGNPHTESKEDEIEATEQTARATQEGKGFER